MVNVIYFYENIDFSKCFPYGKIYVIAAED
jgi:hypothetical protein